MRNIADLENNLDRVIVCDFVWPSEEIKKNFDVDIVICVDAISHERFEDTNHMFKKPNNLDFHKKK